MRELSRHFALPEYQAFRLSVPAAAKILDTAWSFSLFCPLMAPAKKCGLDFACDLVRAQRDRDNWLHQLQDSGAVPKYHPKNSRSLVSWSKHAIDSENILMLYWCSFVLRDYTRAIPGESATAAMLDGLLRSLVISAAKRGWYEGLDLILNLTLINFRRLDGSERIAAARMGWVAESVVVISDAGRPKHARHVLRVLLPEISEQGFSFRIAYGAWRALAAANDKELPLVFLRELRRGPLMPMWNAISSGPVAYILQSDDISLADEIVASIPTEPLKTLLAIAREALNENYKRVARHVMRRLHDYQLSASDFLENIELNRMDDLSGEPLRICKVEGVGCDRPPLRRY
jgi:hypothetical protein